MKKRNKTLLVLGAVLAVLAVSFWWGGSAPGLHGWTAQLPAAETAASQPKTEEMSEASEESKMPAPPKISTDEAVGDEAPAEKAGKPQMDQGIGKDSTVPMPEGKPAPMEPENVTISDQAYSCTISVHCDTVLAHLDWLDAGKAETIPEDGVILPAVTATFYEGESVFHVLQREMKKQKIPMEFMNTPIYQAAYIEGINNLYEFDCGELSGWTYRVNDWFPNYGCSRYLLKDGDVIEWAYTCDLGEDVGGNNAEGTVPS